MVSVPHQPKWLPAALNARIRAKSSTAIQKERGAGQSIADAGERLPGGSRTLITRYHWLDLLIRGSFQ